MHIKTAADHTQADFIFTVTEAWACRGTRCPVSRKSGQVWLHREQSLQNRHCGLPGRDPIRRWGVQVSLKPKGHSKKRRTLGSVGLSFMDGLEGRFVGLLPEPWAQKPALTVSQRSQVPPVSEQPTAPIQGAQVEPVAPTIAMGALDASTRSGLLEIDDCAAQRAKRSPLRSPTLSSTVVPVFYRNGGGFLIPASIKGRWIATDPKNRVL